MTARLCLHFDSLTGEFTPQLNGEIILEVKMIPVIKLPLKKSSDMSLCHNNCLFIQELSVILILNNSGRVHPTFLGLQDRTKDDYQVISSISDVNVK
jgi:hypothetical protein